MIIIGKKDDFVAISCKAKNINRSCPFFNKNIFNFGRCIKPSIVRDFNKIKINERLLKDCCKKYYKMKIIEFKKEQDPTLKKDYTFEYYY